MNSGMRPFQEVEIAYGNGTLEFDPPVVEIKVEAEEQYRGCFHIRVYAEKETVGRIFTTDYRMDCPDEQFHGRDLEVPFRFDARGMEAGDICKGEFYVITSLGEYFLPYEVSVSGARLEGELGEIRNLFHFTNLARTNWEEAKRCFYQEEFVSLLTGGSRQYREAYYALSDNGRNSRDTDFAMEQFLILIRKKQPVAYECVQTEYHYVQEEMPEEIEIRIRRNGWGYTVLPVSVEGSFLTVDRERLTAEDFVGDCAVLKVKTDAKRLYPGKNTGYVALGDGADKPVCRISIDGVPTGRDEQIENRRNKQLTDCMMRLYLDYRTGRRTMEECASMADSLLDNARGIDALMPALYQTHLRLLTGQGNEAVWLLGRARKMMEGREMPLDIYGYFLYLTAMSESEDKKRAGELLDSYSGQYPEHFVLYWGYMHKEDLRSKNPGAVYRKMKELWERGCFHPVLYLETAMVVMDQPAFLADMSPFEIQLLLFMDRYALITEEVKEQIYTAAERIRRYHPVLAKLLLKYPSRDRKKMVKVMCLLYMRGGVGGEEAAKWLREGIELDCRITGLYEAYIYALHFDQKAVLPNEVVRYFAYDTSVDESYLAYVYARVIGQQETISPDYEKKIRTFVVRQLEAGRIDANLAYLYKRILMPEDMTEQMQEKFMELVFVNEVSIRNEDYQYCIVRHAGMSGQERVLLKGGKALVRLYSDEYTILFEDREGLCHWQEDGYEVRSFLGYDRMKRLMRGCSQTGFGALFYRLSVEPIEMLGTKSEFEHVSKGYLWLLKQEGLSEEFRRGLAGNLLKAYDKWDMPEELDAFLQEEEADAFEGKDRAEFVALLCSRGFYRKAFLAAGAYGFEKTDEKVLARLCQYMIEESEGDYDKQLLKLTYRVFEQEKYTETMAGYLEKWFCGSVKQMRDVWRAAVSMELPALNISERILRQILYTGAYTSDREKIFRYYSDNGGRGELIRKYLTMRGEEYLVREEAVEADVFEKMEKDMLEGESFPTGAGLALLKYNSERVSELTEEEKTLCCSLLGESLGEDIYFSYYKAFADIYPVLDIYDENCYVEYRSESGGRVLIHYIEDKPGSEAEHYCCEEMTEIYPGIYQKDFRLFFGERVQYYVTQQKNGEEQFIMSGSLERSEAMGENSCGRFHLINDIALSMELRDYDTADELAMEYSRKEFLTAGLLRIQ